MRQNRTVKIGLKVTTEKPVEFIVLYNSLVGYEEEILLPFPCLLLFSFEPVQL